MKNFGKLGSIALLSMILSVPAFAGEVQTGIRSCSQMEQGEVMGEVQTGYNVMDTGDYSLSGDGTVSYIDELGNFCGYLIGFFVS